VTKEKKVFGKRSAESEGLLYCLTSINLMAALKPDFQKLETHATSDASANTGRRPKPPKSPTRKAAKVSNSMNEHSGGEG
jgi:hypothetical protein